MARKPSTETLRKKAIKEIMDLEMSNPTYRSRFLSYHGYESKSASAVYMSHDEFMSYLKQLYKNPTRFDKKDSGVGDRIKSIRHIFDEKYVGEFAGAKITAIIKSMGSDKNAVQTFKNILDVLEKKGYSKSQIINEFIASREYIVINDYDTKGARDFFADFDVNLITYRFLYFLDKVKNIKLSDEDIFDLDVYKAWQTIVNPKGKQK